MVVELVVDKDGSVSSAKLISGEEPFAAAAVAAAKEFRFEPATRDGAPIRATIRAKIAFEPPHVEAAPAASASAAPTTSSSAGPVRPPEPPIEIEVVGERKEAGQTSIGGGEVKLLPGAFGDPFRAIESLPGVTPIFSGLPFFYVRGAPPGNTGYFIDGVRVPMLFHLGAGPSVVAPGLIDRVDFFPSGYPAYYGRYSGGIVAGVTAEPVPRIHGEWNIRLFDASALLEAPLDDKSDALVSGRYGWPGLVLSLIQSQNSLQYWDYQLRAGRRVTDRDRLSVFVFGAFDRLTDKKKGTVLFDSQFHRIDLRWDRKWDDGHLRVANTLMFDQTGLGDPDTAQKDDRFATRMLGTGLRAELEQRFGKAVLLRAGADAWVERYSLVTTDKGSSQQDEVTFFPTRTDWSAGFRADLVLRPSPLLEIVPGARFDVYIQGANVIPAIDPRLSARIKLARHVTTITTLGVAHQAPSFLVPVPGLKVATLDQGLQEAYQYAQGVEFEFPAAKTTATATFFHTSFRNLNDAIAVCSTDTSNCSLDTRVSGAADGFELLLKRDLSQRVAGWLAYTLSRSTRSFEGRTAPSDFDRTHVLSAVGSIDLGAGWRTGGRFSWQSGRPVPITVSSQAEGVPGSGVPTDGTVPSASTAQIFRKRLPDFYRLDVRIEKRWVYSRERSFAVVLEWFNLFFAKEPTDFRRCPFGPNATQADVDAAKCDVETIGPVTIPSLGVEGTF